MGLSIDTLEEADLEKAINLCVLCFGENWRKIANVDFPACFSNYPYRPTTIIAKNNNNLIGLSMITPVLLTPDAFSIAWLCTHPEYRKQGIAKKLVNACETYAIDNLAMNDSAMFMLASAIDSSYYNNLGYKNASITHLEDPLMVKLYKP